MALRTIGSHKPQRKPVLAPPITAKAYENDLRPKLNLSTPGHGSSDEEDSHSINPRTSSATKDNC